MIRFELHVDTSSAAFGAEDEDEYQAQGELARILRNAARVVEQDGYELEAPNRLYDSNGNRVGYWRVTAEPLP